MYLKFYKFNLCMGFLSNVENESIKAHQYLISYFLFLWFEGDTYSVYRLIMAFQLPIAFVAGLVSQLKGYNIYLYWDLFCSYLYILFIKEILLSYFYIPSSVLDKIVLWDILDQSCLKDKNNTYTIWKN